MIKDMIEMTEGFQTSVNIEYDFNNEDKLNSFIPTKACLEIIDGIISSAGQEHTQRAKILTGAYGRGKSFCVLVALTILFNSDPKLFDVLLSKIETTDPDAYKRISNYITSKKRILPVIINGNSRSMTQSFLSALQRALDLYGINDIMPETFFDSAISVIRRWRKEYPETYSKFESLINCTADEFISKLNENDSETYHSFETIYPRLTSGSVFNPFVNSSVVDIYDKVNIELKRKGFAGIFVVYDEFGKYLESNIAMATESETKMLQDFAEKCCRDSSQQLHIMLICHKDISNYIDMNLSQDKVDGWRGISGRFEHINLTNNFSQMYEIISYAITKNKQLWNSFYETNSSVFEQLHTIYDHSDFLSGRTDIVISGCYPLHPVSTFILPRLSEKVAQNERTLFTFLSSKQKNSLSQFIDKATDEVPFVTPDYIYDYFEDEFRKELSNSSISKIYNLAVKILRNFDKNSLSAKIIKTIAVIYFVEQFEKLIPTTDTLCEIFSIQYDNKVVTECIQDLISNKFILYRKTSNKFLCLKETSGIDINAEISGRVKSIVEKKSLQNIVDECVGKRYLYPTAYNDDMCITRYFEVRFVQCSDYSKAIQDRLPFEITGRIFAVVCDANDDINELKKSTSDNSRHITIIPNETANITDVLAKYLAIKELRDESSDDPILFEEYSIYLDDYSNLIADFITSYLSPELHKSTYYYNGQEIAINRKSQLSGHLSKICKQIYKKTPIINNESLNKDNLPSIAINSRGKILNALLQNEVIEENLGLKGTGQDVSFMRSALIQTGILQSNETGYYLETLDLEPNFANMLRIITEFFVSTTSNGVSSFSDLYEQLMNPDYEIGLKRGVIPIYIAVVLNKMKKDLVFTSNNEEIRLTSDLLSSINIHPESYFVRMENWSTDKVDYLNSLEETFAEHIVDKEKSFNSFAYIVSAISRWYLSLPKCSREMKKSYVSGANISSESLELVKSLKKPNLNSRDFLLITIPKIFSEEPSCQLADRLKRVKTEFDCAKNDLLKSIVEVIKDIFRSTNNSSLRSALSDWYEQLDSRTIEHLFPNNENTVLNLIATVTNDEFIFAERLGKAITGLRVDDWNFEIFTVFKDDLRTFKNTIDNYNLNAEQHNNTTGLSIKLVMTDEHGVEKTRSFEKVEYSTRANLLYQDISAAIDEMGQSITEQEKRQVLIDILTKLCD